MPYRTFTVPGLRANQPFDMASSMSCSRTLVMRSANLLWRSESFTWSPSANSPS